MENSKSLFGDLFLQPKIQNPRIVLDDIKLQVEQESGGHLSADIIPQQSSLVASTLLTYAFSIKSLSTGYSYNLFYITHDVLMYPCFLNTEQMIFEQLPTEEFSPQYHMINGMSVFAIAISNEETLRYIIQTLFATHRAKTIARAIYSQ
ncbi:hypothetical protein [Aeromonas veronii]|uniref:hypothetical protein n=1 Tax=Aeromonas veronii TaxID=654 RepID=UPI001057712F